MSSAEENPFFKGDVIRIFIDFFYVQIQSYYESGSRPDYNGNAPWATQVLESLNKSGIATRSELTDAVRAGQAECVMLNKGKHLLAVLATLQDILHRSGGHQTPNTN